MSIFLVEHTKIIKFTVEAKNREELDDALATMSDYEWRDFYGWEDGDAVCPARADVKVADCGIVDGEIVAWQDYQNDITASLEREEDAR